MGMEKVLVLVTMLAACAVDEEPMPLCAEVGAPDTLFCGATGVCSFEGAQCLARTELDVTWSMVGTSDSRGVPDPVQCTDVISHPCPFLLYTRTLSIAGTRGTWTDATGGKDEAGVLAENRLPWIDELAIGPDGITVPQRGDDGGLRHEAVLAKTRSGYEGDVAWNLFTVAGTTRFHVEIARRD